MAYSVPSGTNTYIPSLITGGLMVGFSRNVDDFPINQYLQIQRVDKNIGYYRTFKSEQAARFIDADLANHVWADGAPRPTGIDNLGAFTNTPYFTQRYAWAFTVGDMAVQQADYDVLLTHARDAAQEAMTARAYMSYAALAAATWTPNTSDVDGGLLAGGKNFTNGTTSEPHIKSVFNAASIAILKSSIGVIKKGDLIFVCNPNDARKMGESPEVNDYLKSSPFAYPNLAGDGSLVDQYGLPPILYGVKIVVDDTVIITSRKGAASLVNGFAFPDGTGYLLSRPGSLEGPTGAAALSTLTGFFYQDEMTAETFYNANDRRTEGSIIENYQIQVTSPKSGYMLGKLNG